MKWSKHLPGWPLVLAGAALIAAFRPALDRALAHASVTSDSYALPSPERAIVFSLGYRSAWADLLFANVLVSYGLHFQYKRRFEYVGDYLELINALDPKYAAPYHLADTLLVLQPTAATQEDYRRARTILARGMAELPYDTDLWLTAGQYLAYLAPPHFSDKAEAQEFRLEGARRLAKACEIIGNNENVPYHCITAAGLFTRAGQAAASQQFIEKMLAITDDPKVRELALGHLQALIGETERDQIELRYRRFSEIWGRDLSFVSKNFLLALGPPFRPALCAGLGSGCATSWRKWGEDFEAKRSEDARMPALGEK